MKALRIVLAVLAGAIVLLVIVAVIIVRSFDLNDYKDEITAYVQERTGRTLTIGNNIEFSLFPWFAVETGGVALSDDPRFGERSIVAVDSLSARVRVWPLLRRRIEIGRIILDGIDVNLGTDAEGRGNWATLIETPAPVAPEVEASEPERPAINALAVEGIELRNGRILWHDPDGEVIYVVRDLTLVTGPVNDDDPVDLTLSLSLLDVASQAAAEIELEAVAVASPERRLTDIRTGVTVRDPRQQERARATLTLGSVTVADGVVRSGPAEVTTTLRRPPIGRDGLEIAARLQSLTLDSDSESLVVEGLAATAGEVNVGLDLAGETVLSEPRLAGTMNLRSARLRAVFEALGIDPSEALGSGDGGAFAASAQFDLELAPLALSVDRYSTTLLGLEASGRAGLDAAQNLVATIDIASFRPTEPLLTLLEAKLPQGVDVRAISTATASASVSRVTGTAGLDIDRLSFTLDSTRIDGRLSIDDVGSPAEIGGALTASGLDNRLLGALFGPWLPAPLVDTNLGEFRLATDFDYELAAQTATFAPLELTAYGLSGDGQLTIVNSGDALALSGRAAIAQFSPRALLARFDLPVPQTSDPTVFSSAELAASFETRGANGEFRDIAIELDESRITGEFGVEDFADPEYRFLLRADRIDADRYLPPRAPPATVAAAATASAAGEKHLGDMRLANEALTATNVTGSASVGHLRIGGMDFEQLSTNLAFGQGRAALSSVRTNLYGGSFAGGLTIDATGDSGVVQLNGNLAGIALRPLLTALLGEARLGGTGNVELDLTGNGDTINDALTTAAGRISVALINGQIDGFNLDRSFCAVFNTADGLPPPAEAPNLTRYAEMRTEATVSDGVASTPNLYARTEHFENSGPGRISLAEGRVDYNLRARLTSPIEIAGCQRINTQVGKSFPYTLSGVLPDVLPKPDISEYLKDRVRDRVQDAILDRLFN